MCLHIVTFKKLLVSELQFSYAKRKENLSSNFDPNDLVVNCACVYAAVRGQLAEVFFLLQAWKFWRLNSGAQAWW